MEKYSTTRKSENYEEIWTPENPKIRKFKKHWFSGSLVFGFSGLQTFGSSDFGIFGFSDFHVFVLSGFRIFGFPDFLVLGFLGFWLSAFESSGFQVFGFSVFGFLIFGFPVFRFWDFGVLRFSDFLAFTRDFVYDLGTFGLLFFYRLSCLGCATSLICTAIHFPSWCNQPHST